MKIIIGIVIVLLIIGVVRVLLEWVKENIGIILFVVVAIAGIYFLGFWTALKIATVICGLVLIFAWIYNYVATKNEKELKSFLEGSCMKLGYMNDSAWVKRLPQFADKAYNNSFESITKKFALDIEKRYIEDDFKLRWLDPASNYLKKAFVADIRELEQVPSEGLAYTHHTPNGKLIKEAMDQISINKIIDGKHLVQKAPLEAEAVCKDHNFMSVESIPEYYMNLYTINEYFRERSVSKEESNLETEEMSLDDL